MFLSVHETRLKVQEREYRRERRLYGVYSTRAINKTPKFHHITPILKSLHWLKINERIHYKILSITYKTLQSQQPSYLHSRLSLQTNNSTRSSSIITFSRPANSSRLKVTNRSFS